MIRTQPRTLILSNRSYEQDVWRCGQVEFENVICAIEDAELLAPRAVLRSRGAAFRQLERVSRRAVGLQFSFAPRLETVRLRRDYDLLFVYAQGLADLTVLDAGPNWRKRCTKAACFVEETWAHSLSRYGRRMFDLLAQFDLIACTNYGSIEPLTRRIGRRCVWLPGAVDTVRFHPGRRPPRRTIDVFAMGRRSDITHRALLQHASREGWTYLFDTVDVNGVRGGDHEQHRQQLAELVKRSRYFFANRARVDRTEDIGAQEEVGLRSYEGAAGGAILIGEAPRGPHVSRLFDWPDAHIHVPFDSTRAAEVIVALDRDPERVAQAERPR